MFRSILWAFGACAVLAGLGRAYEPQPPAAGSSEVDPAGGYRPRPPGAYPCPPGSPFFPPGSYAPGPLPGMTPPGTTLPGTTPPGTDPNAPNPLANLQNPLAQAGEAGGEGARSFNPNFF